MIKIAIVFKLDKKLSISTRGFTLVELIVSMVLMGFFLLSVINLFANISVLSVQPEYRDAQSMLAQDLMEDIKSRRFDELINKVSSNWSTSLGTNTGETSGNKTTFDDVDDFNGFSETVNTPYPGFTRSVSVCYVANTNINNCVASSPTTDYKLVTVTVAHSGVPNLQIKSVLCASRSRDQMY